MNKPSEQLGDCLKYDQWLTDAVAGELEPDRQAELDAHLAACPACRAELAAQRRAWELTAQVFRAGQAPGMLEEPAWEKIFAAMTGELPVAPEAPAPEPVRSFRFVWLEVAASLMILGFVVWIAIPGARHELGAGSESSGRLSAPRQAAEADRESGDALALLQEKKLGRIMEDSRSAKRSDANAADLAATTDHDGKPDACFGKANEPAAAAPPGAMLPERRTMATAGNGAVIRERDAASDKVAGAGGAGARAEFEGVPPQTSKKEEGGRIGNQPAEELLRNKEKTVPANAESLTRGSGEVRMADAAEATAAPQKNASSQQEETGKWAATVRSDKFEARAAGQPVAKGDDSLQDDGEQELQVSQELEEEQEEREECDQKALTPDRKQQGYRGAANQTEEKPAQATALKDVGAPPAPAAVAPGGEPAEPKPGSAAELLPMTSSTFKIDAATYQLLGGAPDKIRKQLDNFGINLAKDADAVVYQAATGELIIRHTAADRERLRQLIEKLIGAAKTGNNAGK